MTERIPILFDRAIRPEWLDFALVQYLSAEDEASLRGVLQELISQETDSYYTIQKTALQLQRLVGFRSPIPREQLAEAYEKMLGLAPDARTCLRLSLVVRANPFFADCVAALRRLMQMGVKGVTLQDLYPRLTSKYGDRGMVPRRVRYVLQTLALLGVLENRKQRWYVTMPECLQDQKSDFSN